MPSDEWLQIRFDKIRRNALNEETDVAATLRKLPRVPSATYSRCYFANVVLARDSPLRLSAESASRASSLCMQDASIRSHRSRRKSICIPLTWCSPHKRSNFPRRSPYTRFTRSVTLFIKRVVHRRGEPVLSKPNKNNETSGVWVSTRLALSPPRLKNSPSVRWKGTIRKEECALQRALAKRTLVRCSFDRTNANGYGLEGYRN